jgi:hypothetical protein
MSMNLSNLTIPELLNLQASAIEELRARGIVRTSNNPLGDYTEWLVSKALGLELTANSAAGHDAVSPVGIRFQIKGRRVTPKNPSRQLSAVRNLSSNNFDHLVAVIFNESYEVIEAVSIPHIVVSEYGAYRSHINGHILHIRGKLLEDERVKNLRNEIDATNKSFKAGVAPPRP